MAAIAVRRMCPPPRSLAAEANGASWSGPDAGPTEYKVAARCYAPKAGSPPIVSAADTAPATKPGAAIQTRYVTEDKAMPRGCKPEGERALSNAERQARHRARLHLSRITAIDGVAVTYFDGTSASASRAARDKHDKSCEVNLSDNRAYPNVFFGDSDSAGGLALHNANSANKQ